MKSTKKKAVLVVHVPVDCRIEDVLDAVVCFGKALKIHVEADIHWLPSSPETHSNQGIVKIPHRRRQIMHTRLPEPPEARMSGEYFIGKFIEHQSRKPLKITAEDVAARRIRRRIEDIKEASRLERESLLDVWDLEPRELK